MPLSWCHVPVKNPFCALELQQWKKGSIVFFCGITDFLSFNPYLLLFFILLHISSILPIFACQLFLLPPPYSMYTYVFEQLFNFPCFFLSTEKVKQTVKIDASTVEIEERGVKLRLTVVDTPGFGDSLNSIDWYVT